MAEQLTLNQRVVGSNPTSPTNNPRMIAGAGYARERSRPALQLARDLGEPGHRRRRPWGDRRPCARIAAFVHENLILPDRVAKGGEPRRRFEERLGPRIHSAPSDCQMCLGGGARTRIRTWDLRLRRATLYPAELCEPMISAASSKMNPRPDSPTSVTATRRFNQKLLEGGSPSG